MFGAGLGPVYLKIDEWRVVTTVTRCAGADRRASGGRIGHPAYAVWSTNMTNFTLKLLVVSLSDS